MMSLACSRTARRIDSLIAGCFPQLTRSQVYECLAYYEDHRGEIDVRVASQMAQASE
jgi:uncharacterized protein (DUF433 family)